MTVSTLGIDEVLSEFTLAFLEDTGLFIANYYTGGLMQYGRNKGCKFINEKCVQDNKIDSKFENEFFNLVIYYLYVQVEDKVDHIFICLIILT